MNTGSFTPSPLPPGWELPTLAEVARINPPLDCPTPSDQAHVNFVPMRAVEPDGGGLLRPEIRPYGKVRKGYTPFQSGDVIMAKITPCMENGKITVVPDLPGTICFGSTEFHVLRAERGIEPKWLSNFLLRHEVRRAAQRKMTGGVGQMRVPTSFLEDAEIPLPPSAEQQRITDTIDELLSDLDAGVAALERVQKKLAHYRAAVLKAGVEGVLTQDWRQQHPSTESASVLLTRIMRERRRRWEEDQLQRFAAAKRNPPSGWKTKYREPLPPNTADLPPLPETWCWASLDQVADIVGGVTKGQRFSPSDKTRIVPYLRVANVQRGFLDLAEIKEIRATEQDIQALGLQVGDVLFNEGGDRDKLGRGWIWEGQIEECIHQNHVFRARFYSRDIQPKIISWSGNSYGQRWFMRTGKQSVNLASINLTVLRSFPVPLVPAAEQEAVVDAVEDQLSLIEHLEANLGTRLKSAHALRQATLRDAFDGRLLPQDPHDEPAAVLLQRIAENRQDRARQVLVAKELRKNRIASGRRDAVRN
jgi:type I restriction enzyme S subunit